MNSYTPTALCKGEQWRPKERTQAILIAYWATSTAASCHNTNSHFAERSEKCLHNYDKVSVHEKTCIYTWGNNFILSQLFTMSLVIWETLHCTCKAYSLSSRDCALLTFFWTEHSKVFRTPASPVLGSMGHFPAWAIVLGYLLAPSTSRWDYVCVVSRYVAFLLDCFSHKFNKRPWHRWGYSDLWHGRHTFWPRYLLGVSSDGTSTLCTNLS